MLYGFQLLDIAVLKFSYYYAIYLSCTSSFNEDNSSSVVNTCT